MSRNLEREQAIRATIERLGNDATIPALSHDLGVAGSRISELVEELADLGLVVARRFTTADGVSDMRLSVVRSGGS